MTSGWHTAWRSLMVVLTFRDQVLRKVLDFKAHLLQRLGVHRPIKDQSRTERIPVDIRVRNAKLLVSGIRQFPAVSRGTGGPGSCWVLGPCRGRSHQVQLIVQPPIITHVRQDFVQGAQATQDVVLHVGSQTGNPARLQDQQSNLAPMSIALAYGRDLFHWNVGFLIAGAELIDQEFPQGTQITSIVDDLLPQTIMFVDHVEKPQQSFCLRWLSNSAASQPGGRKILIASRSSNGIQDQQHGLPTGIGQWCVVALFPKFHWTDRHVKMQRLWGRIVLKFQGKNALILPDGRLDKLSEKLIQVNLEFNLY